MPLLIRTYLFFTFIFSALSYLIIYLRLWSGKEDQSRFKEKLGRYEWDRSNSKLIWFHGASVGELISIIPLIKYYEKNKDINQILITSSTVAEANVIQLSFWSSFLFFKCEITQRHSGGHRKSQGIEFATE